MALLANLHHDPKKGRAFKPADFHPIHQQRRSRPLPTSGIEVLKQVFVR